MSATPDITYAQQSDASFNDEEQYRGLAKYKDEYEERMHKMQDANRNLDEKINHLYANILTLMGVFVSVFSIIMVNFSNITSKNYSKDIIISMNLSLGIVIALFIGLLLVFINKANNKWFLLLYIIIMFALIVGLVVIL